jgi:hypothetical protein
MLLEDIKALYSGGYRIIIASENSHGMGAVAELLTDNGYAVAKIPSPKAIFNGFLLISVRVPNRYFTLQAHK